MLGMIVRPLLELITAVTIIDSTLPLGPGMIQALTRMDDGRRLAVVVAVALLADIVIQTSRWAREVARGRSGPLGPSLPTVGMEKAEPLREDREVVVMIEWTRGVLIAKRDSRN